MACSCSKGAPPKVNKPGPKVNEVKTGQTPQPNSPRLGGTPPAPMA